MVAVKDGYGVIWDKETGNEFEVWLSPVGDDYFAPEEIEKVQKESVFNVFRGIATENEFTGNPIEDTKPFIVTQPETPFKTSNPHGFAGQIIMNLPDNFMKPELKILGALKAEESD